jgi:hypothetical protein
MARHTPWSRHGTTHSMEQIWHDTLHEADMARHTPWSRHGTTHSMEQIWHDTLHGVDMARHTPRSRHGTTNSMEQIWHGQYAPWNRFCRQASSRSFSCDIPRLLRNTFSNQQTPRKSLQQQELRYRQSAVLHVSITRNTERHCVYSECELQTFPATTANATS